MRMNERTAKIMTRLDQRLDDLIVIYVQPSWRDFLLMSSDEYHIP